MNSNTFKFISSSTKLKQKAPIKNHKKPAQTPY